MDICDRPDIPLLIDALVSIRTSVRPGSSPMFASDASRAFSRAWPQRRLGAFR
jgi:hypothetical protein